MSRRWFVVPALLALAAPFAQASDDAADRVCIRESIARVASPRYDLSPLFALAATESVQTDDGVSAPHGPMEVIVARIGPDGKLVYACVDSEEGVRAFLEAPASRLKTKQAQEQ